MASTSKSITDWADRGTGDFHRQVSSFRSFVSPDPSAKYPAERNRYHLYVSYACPWAHRTLIARKLKGLDDIIDYTVVHWHMGEKGWRFVTPEEVDTEAVGKGDEHVRPDPVKGHEGYKFLREIYFAVEPGFEGRFTVPVLFDVKRGEIVSNESSEILRMFNSAFNGLLPDSSPHKQLDLYPPHLRAQIDETNEWHYNDINNGVYKTGFATTQEAYERALHPLFSALDRAESHLSQPPSTPQIPSPQQPSFYFSTPHPTETDIRLYTTIVRFDPVYVQHFKCNVRDIRSGYPALHTWLRHLYWGASPLGDESLSAAFGPSTTNFTHIKKHYTTSHPQINPKGITPVGPLPHILGVGEEVRSVKPAAAEAARGAAEGVVEAVADAGLLDKKNDNNKQ